MSKLLIATTNPGKLLEIRALLAGLNVDLVTPDDLNIHLHVEEDGDTYAENALRKGVALAQASRLLTLADDSGLEVDALGGLPGIRSARFSPKPEATDADRRAILLERLQGYPPPWKARFRCVVALVSPAGARRLAEGECHGEIITQERGANGFGYDPIFWIPELQRTMAELSLEAKNQISHRARAVRAAIPLLDEMLA